MRAIATSRAAMVGAEGGSANIVPPGLLPWQPALQVAAKAVPVNPVGGSTRRIIVAEEF
ncbi:MAG: hypothetical protein ACREFJ_00270 [Acetobacteraceae bacterium]